MKVRTSLNSSENMKLHGQNGNIICNRCSIAAVIMVIGMFALYADITSTSTTAAVNVYGHYTVKIMDPNGNIKSYIQTDNAVTHQLKNCMFDSFMGSSLGAACGVTSGGPTFFRIGDNGDQGTSEASANVNNPYSDTGLVSRTGATASITGGGDPEADVTWDNTGDVIVIIQTDLETATVGNANGGLTNGPCVDVDADTLIDCHLDEVGWFDDGGVMLSHATFTPGAGTKVSAGDQVDMTLTITLS